MYFYISDRCRTLIFSTYRLAYFLSFPIFKSCKREFKAKNNLNITNKFKDCNCYHYSMFNINIWFEMFIDAWTVMKLPR